MTIRCIPLSEAPEAVGLLARWFKTEWAEHYDGRSLAEVEADFPIPADGGLPLIFVAFDADTPCGTAALRANSNHALGALSPWLGGLYVEPGSRRRGVARALLAAAETEARRRGFARLHAETVDARALFEAVGWDRIAETFDRGLPIAVYARALLGKGERSKARAVSAKSRDDATAADSRPLASVGTGSAWQNAPPSFSPPDRGRGCARPCPRCCTG